MKTINDVAVAIDAVIKQVRRSDLDERQRCVLIGMLSSLEWIAGTGGQALDILISGQPVEATYGKQLDRRVIT